MQFVTVGSSQFQWAGKRFRFVGMNYYPMVIGGETSANITTLFKAARDKGINVFRIWCFDTGNPPVNAGGNFKYVSVGTGTVGSNILPNPGFETDTSGWGLDGDFSRSSAQAHTGTWSIAQNSAGGSFQNFTTINDANGIAVSANTTYTLVFWSKIAVSGGAPILSINTGSAYGTTIANSFPGDSGGVWTRNSLTFNTGAATKIWLRLHNNNGATSGNWDDFTLGAGSPNSIAYVESTFVQLDMVLDLARQYNIKVILSLADNPTYGTKQGYCHLADAINGTSLEGAGYPYVGFWNDSGCRKIYKDFFNKLATRVNTINGRTYSNDDSIFSWEFGNEMRYDVFDSEGGTQNTAASFDIAQVKSWIIDVGNYMKSVDTNHLIGYGDMGHTWQWVNGDTVSNGSGYGVDYNIFTAMSQIDYLDFHCYPNQGDNVHLQTYGQRLGYPNAVTAEGFRAQIRDYVASAKANGKPAVCGEIGEVREIISDTSVYPLYPRNAAFIDFMNVFFNAGGDGVIYWSATISGGGSYSIDVGYWNGSMANSNWDDRPLMGAITRWMFKGGRIPVASDA